jgi:hypothetical protein
MHSKAGKAIATPAPRSNARRDRRWPRFKLSGFELKGFMIIPFVVYG